MSLYFTSSEIPSISSLSSIFSTGPCEWLLTCCHFQLKTTRDEGAEGESGREICEDQEGGAPGQGLALSYNDSLTRWAGLEKYRPRALCSHLPEHALDVSWKSTPHTLPNVTSSKGLLERKVKGLLERKVNADIKKNSEVLIITRLLGQLDLCTSPSW